MIGQEKNNRTLYYQIYHLLEKAVITFFFLTNPDASELSWNILKYKENELEFYETEDIVRWLYYKFFINSTTLLYRMCVI